MSRVQTSPSTQQIPIDSRLKLMVPLKSTTLMKAARDQKKRWKEKKGVDGAKTEQ